MRGLFHGIGERNADRKEGLLTDWWLKGGNEFLGDEREYIFS